MPNIDSQDYILSLDTSKYYIYYKIVKLYGEYIEFNLFKKSATIQLSNEECEKLANMVSFIFNEKISSDEFNIDENTKVNDLIEKFNELKEGYVGLKETFGISKTNAIKIFRKLKKKNMLLSMPQYYLSLQGVLYSIFCYMIGDIEFNELKPRLGVLNFNGGLSGFKVTLFEKFIEGIKQSIDEVLQENYFKKIKTN